MPLVTDGYDRIKQIYDYIETMLNDHSFEQELKMIIIGMRADKRLLMPCLWVILDPVDMTIDDGALAIKEYWSWDLLIGAMADYKDYKQSRETAESLVFDASREFLRDRTLGGLVDDTVRTLWIPAYTRLEEAETVVASAMRLQLRTFNKEVF